MRMIKWTCDVISGNLREARKYIEKAYEMRESCRPVADWCRDMAARHLEFNVFKSNFIFFLLTICLPFSCP